MLLQDKRSGVLVKILDIENLFDPNKESISGRGQQGEEEQEPESYKKDGLIFPSGEELPLCWKDADYRKVLSN